MITLLVMIVLLLLGISSVYTILFVYEVRKGKIEIIVKNKGENNKREFIINGVKLDTSDDRKYVSE